ncbi:MAG: PAS domain S-box protein [Actinomycetota bacterium]|nr:PAS domain S-box protein [Actinomycetota bacterium]
MSRSEVAHGVVAAQHLEVAFEQAAIGMALVDFDGAFLAVNPALCELVGRSEQDLLDRTWQSITHPDDVALGQHEVAKALAGEERAFRLPKRYIRPDGTIIWVLLTVSLIRKQLGEPLSLLTQVVDITEQRRAEEELARLASIVESSDDAILSKNLEGTILSWNRAAERMYGYTASEIIGRSVRTLVPADRQQEVDRLLESARRGESVRNLETVRLRKDSSTIDVSLTLSPIVDHSGVVVRASTITRDISAQKRMTAELDRTLAALESALDEAHRSEARSRAFLSDAAHHLRNPVAGIRACAETLLRGVDPAGRERLLGEVARQTSHVGRLVDRLLRIARLEQGERLVFERYDLVSLCQDEVERTQSLAPHLEILLRADDPLHVDLDVRAVREILGNVLENARRHAVRGIDVSVAERDGTAYVRVIDDGAGLPAGKEAQAFEAFATLDGTGGSGLGLAVSQALARAHGGDLVYEDRAFVLRLPGRAP